MANYLRIDGEAEIYNLAYIRRMWKAVLQLIIGSNCL